MCKNCKCQECNPPPKPSETGTILATNGTPFEFTDGELMVYPGEYQDGRNKFVLTGWANIYGICNLKSEPVKSQDESAPTNPAPTSSSRKPASGPASGDLATKPTPANG